MKDAKLMFAFLNILDGYTAPREEFNDQSLSGSDSAAAFLDLNSHCFNCLIRYNQAGNFNVGWGKYKAHYFPEEEIAAFTEMSHNCVFMNAGFTSYVAGGFNWDDQIQLAECCVAAHQSGARIVISNSSTISRIKARRSISSKGGGR